jgi:acyl-CoA reductase-like NAD-dependent aldehyde dehydrogenase
MSTRADQQHIRHADRFFIGGEWVKPSSSSRIDVRDSATEEVFLSVAEAQVEDVDRAVAAARKAFDDGPWPRMTHKARAVWLNKIADAWTNRADAFAETWTRESGVLHSIAKRAVVGPANTFRFHAGLADTFEWEAPHVTPDGQRALLVREPVGVVGAIIPWNAPNALGRLQDGRGPHRGMYRGRQGFARSSCGPLSARGNLRGNRPSRGRIQLHHGGA